jgi:ankyrin repeat protein
MSASDAVLRDLVYAIIANDAASWRAQLTAAPALARAAFATGATRNAEEGYFLDPIKRWIYTGDTALHFAAAAYRADAVKDLLNAAAEIHARNRHGHTPLHSAAAGSPGQSFWNPQAQAATIATLIEAGADPNATDKRGAAPIHIAVRTRSAAAVRALLERGADPVRPNGNGSTPMLLATQNTGRGGSGSPEAKAQQQEILRMLDDAIART